MPLPLTFSTVLLVGLRARTKQGFNVASIKPTGGDGGRAAEWQRSKTHDREV